MTIKLTSVNFKGDVFTPNRNNRYYPPELVKREMEKYSERFKTGETFGRMNPEPDFDGLNPRDFAFKINKIENDDGKIICDCTTLSTPKGLILRDLVLNNVPMKMNPVGFGSVNDNNEVNGDYSLLNIDICFDGSEHNE